MSHAPGDKLRVLLQRAQWTPEQLARRLNARATQLGLTVRIDPKSPYKWLRGTIPREPWPRLAAALLGEWLDQRLQPEDLGWPTRHEGLAYLPADDGLAVPWTVAGTISATSQVMENPMVDRRVFLSLTGAALTQPALEWLIAQPAADITNTAGRRVLHSHVDNIDQLTSQLRALDDQSGGGAVLDLARSQVRFVLDLLRNSSYDESVGARLHAATAELLRIAGFASHEAGQHPEAQRFWVAGLHAAHTAGDKAIGANILAFMSFHAMDLERYAEAVRLAEAARQSYPGASPRVAAILDLFAAEAYAAWGDTEKCRAALESGFNKFRNNPVESGEPIWAYWIGEYQLHYRSGRSYLRLGDWRRAQLSLTTAMRHSSGEFPTLRRLSAVQNATLAEAHARAGEPEQASAVANRAVDLLANDVNSARTVSYVRRVQDVLQPYRGVPAVQEFTRRTDDLLGTHT